MTNIVYWNIQKFSNGRIAGDANALARLNVIKGIIRDATPDIIVVVEVTKGIGGASGATTLLNDLRNNTTDPNANEWRMVPLQIVGKSSNCECVAVYYRGISTILDTNDPTKITHTVTRYFTGPFVWTGGANGSSQDPTIGTPPSVVASNYANASFLVPPGSTARIIPDNTLTSSTVQYRAGQPEQQSAARIDFDMQAATSQSGLKKLKSIPSYGTLRQPVMTTFYEVTTEASTGNTSTRNLTLFSVHSPPAFGDATTYINKLLGNTVQIIVEPDATKNETKLICGDFNLNTLTDDGKRSENYDTLTSNDVKYISLNSPDSVTTIAPQYLETYQGYYATHIGNTPKKKSQRKASTRFLWSENLSSPSPYPGYRYISSTKSIPNTYAVDNILLWGDATNPPTTTFTIMNPIVGTPYTSQIPTPTPPLGSITTTCQFTYGTLPSKTWPQMPNAAIFENASADILVNMSNYGLIRSTSDHLPLCVTL
jgi:hypothetical protein|tara:strand:+ start:1943 stop:3394 length:1452 start_codon:yes stop_codon:yes gene_type:complete